MTKSDRYDDHSHTMAEIDKQVTEVTVTDPVCGMSVDTDKNKLIFDHEGTAYHFCSEKCHEKFEADPEFYISGAHKQKKNNAVAGTEYTCPMHPEIIQDHPGDCPKCGMALEPIGIPTDEPNEELIDFTQRFWISAICSFPLLILTMGPLIGLNIREWLGETTTIWIELALSTPVILWAAIPFFKRGWNNIQP